MSDQHAPDWTRNLVPTSLVTMTPDDMAVRDAFVREYLVDYNARAAVLRCGWCAELAEDTVNRFMSDNYVQWKLSQSTYERRDNDNLDEIEQLDRMVVEGLKREANYKGPGASQAARVNALKALKERVDKVKDAANNRKTTNSGVMVVPAMAQADNWENDAVAIQEKLRQETLADVNDSDET